MSVPIERPEDAGDPDEEWRPIPGYSRYAVNRQGQVVSYVSKNPRVLKQAVHDRGYLFVDLYDDERVSKTLAVHRIVALTWHGEPFPGAIIRHLNGISSDNRAENLAWGTHSENNLDAVKHGSHRSANKTHCKNGHEFTPQNTRVPKRNRLGQANRICKTCESARHAAWRKKIATKEVRA